MAYQAAFATMENSRGTHYQTSGTSVRTQLRVRDNGASHFRSRQPNQKKHC